MMTVVKIITLMEILFVCHGFCVILRYMQLLFVILFVCKRRVILIDHV